MKVIHFGAGNIGKGFIANILSGSGFQICFVDVDLNNILSIRNEKGYLVEILESSPKIIRIENVEILDGINEKEQIIKQISSVNLITTSVGVNNLVKIAPVIVEGLINRFEQTNQPINIIANENAINATNILKEEIMSHFPKKHIVILNNVGFVNSAIDRQSVSRQYKGKQITSVEPFWEWVINQKEIISTNLPRFVGATYVNDLQPYIEKKLYIVNLGHATLAYLGFIANLDTVFDTLSNPNFKQFAQTVMQSSSEYFILNGIFTREYLNEYINNALTRFANPYIQDSVLRVAKSPIRKLSINERIVAPLLQLHKSNLPIDQLCKVVSMALLFNDTLDSESCELQRFLQKNSIEKAISYYSQINEKTIISKIKQYYDKFLAITSNDTVKDRIKKIESILLDQ